MNWGALLNLKSQERKTLLIAFSSSFPRKTINFSFFFFPFYYLLTFSFDVPKNVHIVIHITFSISLSYFSVTGHSDVFWSLSLSLLDLLQRQVSSLVNKVFVRYGKKSFSYVIDCVQVHINSNIELCSQPCQTVTCSHIKFSLDEVEEISLD